MNVRYPQQHKNVQGLNMNVVYAWSKGLAMGCAMIVALAGAPGAIAADDPPARPAAASAGAGQIDLRPRYTEGEEFGFEQRVHREEAITAVGQAQTTMIESTLQWRVRVLKVHEAGSTIALTIKSVKATLDQISGEDRKSSAWDSEANEPNAAMDNPIENALRQLVGFELSLELGPDGQITGVSGNEGLQPLPGVLQQFAFQAIATEPVKLQWQPLLWIKRGTEPAAIGQTWKDESVILAGPMSKIRSVINSKLDGATGSVATITMTGDLEFLPAREGEPTIMKASDVKIDGSCAWDLAKRGATSLEMRRKYKLSGSAQGIEIKRDLDTTFKFTRN